MGMTNDILMSYEKISEEFLFMVLLYTINNYIKSIRRPYFNICLHIMVKIAIKI